MRPSEWPVWWKLTVAWLGVGLFIPFVWATNPMSPEGRLLAVGVYLLGYFFMLAAMRGGGEDS